MIKNKLLYCVACTSASFSHYHLTDPLIRISVMEEQILVSTF